MQHYHIRDLHDPCVKRMHDLSIRGFASLKHMYTMYILCSEKSLYVECELIFYSTRCMETSQK